MNQKVIAAMVLSIVLIGLVGTASARFSSYTDIRGTHFTSESSTRVSGMPVTSHYTQSFIAEMATPSYTPDFSYTNMDLRGSDYSLTSSIRSSPTRNTVSTIIANPSDVSGTLTRRNCALLGDGIKEEVVILPQPIEKPTRSFWQGAHPAGFAYPGRSTEQHRITRP